MAIGRQRTGVVGGDNIRFARQWVRVCGFTVQYSGWMDFCFSFIGVAVTAFSFSCPSHFYSLRSLRPVLLSCLRAVDFSRSSFNVSVRILSLFCSLNPVFYYTQLIAQSEWVVLSFQFT